MKPSGMTISLAFVLPMTMAGSAGAHSLRSAPRRCAPDAVAAGTICLDTYEASVWRVAYPTTTNSGLVRKIQRGEATREDLLAGGATQLGIAGDNYAPCTDDGRDCVQELYAVSLPAETPASQITWFQAQEACANSGKRLPTNAEWQVGANGSPDEATDDGVSDCNTNTGSRSLTGSRSNCVSTRGAYDMAGNLIEWVADWVPASTGCPNWPAFSDDAMCLSGASESKNGPGALLRGGWFAGGPASGPLTVMGNVAPFAAFDLVGFRCAR